MVYAVFAPLIFAIIIPFLSRLKHKIHTGWLILPIPLLIFSILSNLLEQVLNLSANQLTGSHH